MGLITCNTYDALPGIVYVYAASETSIAALLTELGRSNIICECSVERIMQRC